MKRKKPFFGKKLALFLLLLSFSGQSFAMQNNLVALLKAGIVAFGGASVTIAITHLLYPLLPISLTGFTPDKQNVINHAHNNTSKQTPPTNQNFTDQHLFFEAVVANDIEKVKELIDGKKINIDEKYNYISALYHCAYTKKFELMKVLIECGANVNTTGVLGHAPLHICALTKYPEGAKILLENGADPNLKSYYGNTALHFCKCPDVARILIAKGADIYAKNSDGETPRQHPATTEETRDVIEGYIVSKIIERTLKGTEELIEQEKEERNKKELTEMQKLTEQKLTEMQKKEINSKYFNTFARL